MSSQHVNQSTQKDTDTESEYKDGLILVVPEEDDIHESKLFDPDEGDS